HFGHRRDGSSNGRPRGWSHSPAYLDPSLHRSAWSPRRQEGTRTVRGAHPQASHRHSRAQPPDPRGADEARPVRWCGRRDQELTEPNMAKIDVFNLKREKVGEVDLSDEVF